MVHSEVGKVRERRMYWTNDDVDLIEGDASAELFRATNDAISSCYQEHPW
jgi:hypothetical protein